MEPIKVILIDNENIFLKILSSPILSFVLGSMITIVLTFLMQKRTELQSKKEKILDIHKGINEVIDSLKTMLYYLNPESNLSLDILFSDNNYASEEEFNNAVQKNKRDIIRNKTDRIIDIKESLNPMIELYISKANRIYFRELFRCVDIIWQEFVEVPFIMKTVYEPVVQSMIVKQTRDSFLNNMAELFDLVYVAETSSRQAKINKKIYRKYGRNYDYTIYFEEYKVAGNRYHELINRNNSKSQEI